MRFKQLYLNPSYFRKAFVLDIHLSLNRKQNNSDQRLRNIINFTFEFGHMFLCASLVAQRLKYLPAMQETWVWSLIWEDPLEKEMATHSSILAWRIPWTEEPGGLQSTGSQRVGHDWATSLSLSLFTFPLCNIFLYAYINNAPKLVPQTYFLLLDRRKLKLFVRERETERKGAKEKGREKPDL